MDWRPYLTFEEGKMGGQPCIRGHRFTVYDVLDYLASGMTADELISDFPFLTKHDIQAALAFVSQMFKGTVFLNA